MNCFRYIMLSVLIFPSLSINAANDDTSYTFTKTYYQFDIPGQELSIALIEFGIQSHISVVVDSKHLKDLRSSPVVGLFSPKQALKLLLSRSHFDSFYDNRLSSIILKPQDKPIVAEEKSALPKNDEPDYTEEVIVSGIRASLLKAMDIKFQADGVIDAITKEDIGKFPDTNLAESLQRLSGVTISYSNNEGNKINVRGLDSDFNLVLLNGRQMPTADINSNVSVGTRSFNFADLSSNNIAAVEVFKNSSANQPTGGIGSVINIKTARPFDFSETSASIEMKMVTDTTTEEGNSITPELSGLFSTTFAEEKFGFLISGSYQDRNSRAEIVEMNWRKNNGLVFLDNILPEALNAIDPIESIWYADNITFTVTDYQRTRANAQAVFQYSPSDKFSTTFDYTFSALDVASSGFDLYSRFDGYMLDSDITVEDNFTISQSTEYGGSHHFARFKSETKNVNQSFGINIEFSPSDTWFYELDMHQSKAELRPYGVGNRAVIALTPDNIYSQSYNSNFDIPEISYQYVDQYDTSGNPSVIRDNTILDDLVNHPIGFTEWSTLESKITQLQFSGLWENDNYSSFVQHVKFGLSHTTLDNQSTSQEYTIYDPQAYSDDLRGLYDANLFTQQSTSQLFDHFNGGLSATPYIYDFDLLQEAQSIATRLNEQGFTNAQYSTPYASGVWDPFGSLQNDPRENNGIKEKTRSAYIQVKLATNTITLPTEVVAGLRYEKNELNTRSHFAPANNVAWRFLYYFAMTYSDEKTTLRDSNNSDELLPSLTIKTNVTDSLIARLALSKTLTRPKMNLIRAEQKPISDPIRTSRLSFLGSPELSPYTSKNFDLSLDWYYSDTDYIALSFFRKKVDGYPIVQTVETPLFGITDVYTGPRAEAVRDELTANDITPNDENVFNRLLELYPPEGDERGIIGNSDDPILLFTAYKAINSEQVNIDGWEFTWQQLFWQSGFGIVFNYTHVESDAEFELSGTALETTLPSSSNFYNFTSFFDKYGLQVRLAYHWNDEYPTITSPTGPTGGVHPYYTESYGQWDGLISYTWNKKLTISLEGINLTDETQRTYDGAPNRLARAEQYGPRYQMGLRYSF